MLHGLGQRGAAQLRPDPTPPRAVFLLQVVESRAGLGHRQRRELAKGLPQLGLLGLVVLGPGFAGERRPASRRCPGRLGLAEQVDQAGVAGSGWRRTASRRSSRPASLWTQALSPDEFAVLDGVEAVVALAPAAEGLPARSPSAPESPWGRRARSSRSSTGSSLTSAVEVLVFERTRVALALRSTTGTSSNFPSARRIDVAWPVPGDIQPKPAAVGLEERRDRPVLAVVLRPEDAPVLQLGQGPQFGRTILGRPQGRTADAWQVEDRHEIRRYGHIGNASSQHRSQPDGGTDAIGLVIGPKREKLR